MILVSHPFCGLMSQTLGARPSCNSTVSSIDLKSTHHLCLWYNYLVILNPGKTVLIFSILKMDTDVESSRMNGHLYMYIVRQHFITDP